MIIDEALIKSWAPSRKEDGHKGTFGTALIVAGSRFMTGAQTLAVSSCLRSGVGMTRVLGPEESYASTRVSCPCALFSPYDVSVSKLLRQTSEYLTKATAALIGPGIDTEDQRSFALLSYLLEKAPCLVVDAGALNLLAHFKEELLPVLKTRRERGLEVAILTPHVGEFKRLIGKSNVGEDDLEKLAAEFATTNDCIVVLKNHVTITQTPEKECYINIMSNSGMSKGGSGDVLAGLIVGMLAQGIEPKVAAVSSVYIHGFAGCIAASEVGKRAMLPTDVIKNLTYAYESVNWK